MGSDLGETPQGRKEGGRRGLSGEEREGGEEGEGARTSGVGGEIEPRCKVSRDDR